MRNVKAKSYQIWRGTPSNRLEKYFILDFQIPLRSAKPVLTFNNQSSVYIVALSDRVETHRTLAELKNVSNLHATYSEPSFLSVRLTITSL